MEPLSNISGRFEQFQNVATFPGPRPIAVATLVWDRECSLDLWNFLEC